MRLTGEVEDLHALLCLLEEFRVVKTIHRNVTVTQQSVVLRLVRQKTVLHCGGGVGEESWNIAKNKGEFRNISLCLTYVRFVSFPSASGRRYGRTVRQGSGM